ncbi:hypothetical protein K1719_021185 [Acacia pycnantha]|nr:hypothetical protein K1719_021185 [Acacia pycnantha]
MSSLSPETSPSANSTAPPLPPDAATTNDTSPSTQSNPMSPTATPAPVSKPNGMSQATLTGLVVGTVFGSLLMLVLVGICAFFYKRSKRRRMRKYGLDDCSAAPPSQPKADQFGGLPQQWQSNIPPPTDGGKPSPPLGVWMNQKASSHNVASSPMYTSGPSGFGYVHKGVLPNGKTVAIKQLKSGSRQGEREFQAEVEVISRVHHRHLVSLVGYCIAGTQRMLVYEFVPNDTLEFHLHGKDRTAMDWATRIKIAIGSAKGLAYLHEDCHPRIIHRDIKASNILLDDNFEAKVADFGLAKISSDVDTHVSTRVMGTFGYLAPEYAASGKLTEKSDVFSFGVMLLELITGRRPVDKTESFTDDSMVEWARPLLSQAMEKRNFDALADPRLQERYDSDEMLRMIACAANCVRHSARQRPRMSQVVRALEGNISLDDLNEGNTPGHSRAFNSFESSGYDTGQYNEDLKKFRKLALEQETSEYSGPSSDFGKHQSASSSSGLQNAPEKK